MENKKSLDVFNSMPVSKAIFKNAVPAIAAMIMVLIYNLADTFFIGQTHDPFQVAAVSLATPVFLIFMAIGTIFGIGGTSVISRSMGEGRKDYAKKVCSFCMWSCVIVGIIISLLFFIFMDQILVFIGASSDTIELTRSYLIIVICSGPFVLISNCYSNVLRAEGQSNKAMMGMLIGNLLNIILDPIMILGFGWNITGAAIATVIGNIIGALYYIAYFMKGKSMLSINIKDFTIKDKVCSSVLAIGIPASLGSILMSVSQIIMNSQMASYGDMALAGIGVAMKVIMITGMVCIGLGQGIQPLLGFCVGSKNWDRYKKILKFSLWFALILGVSLTAICYLFTNQIVSAFLTEVSAFDYGVEFSRILLSTSALFGVFYVLINALQATGAAVSSLIINISRQGIIYIPALFILKAILGINGLVWAQPVADILSICLAIILYVITSQKLMKDNVDSKVVLEKC
ncbi:MATE family efflux transporter [Clostridium sp. NSJ-145]|uniref:MATE family efflux transporter n=1 Tax=Clostridium sp. NSJ-145 TaxID=2897777 RepID=UPI001E576995|nr:MATE family efflux transporter [Clostridium sp. NSJ-145]MCD2500908.1 MATE family efflux transporter [Clostridium sp. NSJ-145]